MHGVDTGPAGQKILDMLWLELTARCNLHCRHCYVAAGVDRPLEGDMTLEDWQAIVDEALDLGASAFQLIGGEPTLHPHFRTLLAYVGRANPRLLEVYTNATRLTDEIVGCLNDNGARVAASFYAEAPNVHDAVTLRPGSWKRTVAGIERAVAADLPLRIGIVETAANRMHVAPAIAFLQRLGVRDIGVDTERGIGRGQREAAATADSVVGEDLSQLCGQCGKARLCVTSTGEIYPCVFSRETLLGRARNGLRAALGSATLAGFCAAMDLERRLRIEAKDYSDFCNPGPCHPSNPCSPSGPQPDVVAPSPASRLA
jgi:MoaA/NifB/PqqE/SkfB family radical SAM enzyme